MSNYAGIFYRIRQRLPDKCLKSIYFALVYPHLLHGIEVYANTRHLSKLMILNNKILRILQNKPYRSPVKDLYTAYNTLPIPQLHIQQLLLLVHKCIYHKYMVPQIYLDYFYDYYIIYSRDTRRKTNLHMYSVNSTFGQRSFKFQGASLWNELPKSIKNMKSLRKFKEALKLHLLNSLCHIATLLNVVGLSSSCRHTCTAVYIFNSHMIIFLCYWYHLYYFYCFA